MAVVHPPTKEVCSTELIHRQWKESHAVRHVAIRCDRLFEMPKTKNKDTSDNHVKICIAVAVHNQQVLIPLLHNMAAHPKHPVPYVKALAHQKLGPCI